MGVQSMIGERILELTGDIVISNLATERVHSTQGEVFRAEHRDNNVLFYILNGTRDYLENGRKYLTVTPRSLMLMPADSSYQSVSTSEEDGLGISIDFNLKNAAGEEIILDTLPSALLRDEDGYYIGKMRQVIDCLYRGGLYCLKAKSLFYDLLFSLASDQVSAAGKGASVLPAVRYMECHPAESCRIDALAELCFMSRSTFYRRFQEEYHESPAAWHLRRRVERGRELLREGLTVEETARRLGFCDAAHFSRVFRHLTGTGAGSVRREAQ